MVNKQFNNQIEALKQAGGNTRLEWHFLEQKVADDFLELIADDVRFADLVRQGRIEIIWTPMAE